MSKRASIFMRLVVSLTFIFSGLIKLNDPVGFALKIEAYFHAFSIDFTPLFLKLLPYTWAMAVGVATIEVILGIALLLQFQAKLTLSALLLLTAFFTCLTFYTAALGRVGSCGCFGDAIPLTPWQSFSKSILLLLALSLLYEHTKTIGASSLFTAKLYWVSFSAVCALTLGWYTTHRLPIVEFGPYRVGSNIPRLIQPKAPLRYKYFVKKDGQLLETIAYPKDTSYHLVKTELLNPTARPVINNFTIWHEQGELTQEILQGNKLLIIVQHPAKIDAMNWQKLKAFAAQLRAPMQPWWLIPFHAKQESLPTSFAGSLGWASADLLKSMLRAEVGFLWLQDGVVQGKWPFRDLVHAQKDLAQLGFYQP